MSKNVDNRVSTKVREAVTSDDSPYNRLLAQALLERITRMNTDEDSSESRKELRAWAEAG